MARLNLPILSKGFFEKHRPDTGFFSKWRELAPWTEQCLPIYEWQGVLFVGCLQAPESVFQNLKGAAAKTVFVLCDPETLKSVWYDYQGTVVVSRKPKAAAVAVLPSDLSLPKLPESLPVDVAGFESLLQDEPLSQNPPAKIDDVMAAIDAAELAALENDSEKEGKPADGKHEEELLELHFKDVAPPQLERTKLTVIGEDEEAVKKPVEKKITATAKVSAPKAPAVAAKTALTSSGAPSETSTSITKTFNPVSGVQPFEKAKPTKTEVIYTKPGALSSNRGTIEKKEITKTALGALNSTSKPKLESFVENIFSEMSYHFQKTMLLLKDGETMKPWRWDSKFSTASDEAHSVPLAQPSPFRVVLRTQKPYHGYIIPNDINDKFFDEWNSSQSPEHLTITPIIVEDHVIGMLLGIGEKSADNKASLQLAEKLSSEMAKQIRSQPEFFKAA